MKHSNLDDQSLLEEAYEDLEEWGARKSRREILLEEQQTGIAKVSLKSRSNQNTFFLKKREGDC